MSEFTGLGPDEQWKAWHEVATDDRPRVKTGWPVVDQLLHRESLGPGTFALFGGRMHTRKTAVIMNMIANMLSADVPVALVGLDEAPYQYVAKLASVLTQVSHSELELDWDSQATAGARQMYMALAHRLTVSQGQSPKLDDLSRMLDMAEVQGARPRVVFIDYMAKLGRSKYSGKNVEFIPMLAQELSVWTKAEQVVTVAIHHAGKTDDGNNRKYHGDQPMTVEQLRYAVDEPADIVFATYRPELDPVGNMTQAQALREGIDQDTWQDAADYVVRTRDLTFLQLLKNRPGTRLERKGIPLRSTGESQYMVPTDMEVDDDMVMAS